MHVIYARMARMWHVVHFYSQLAPFTAQLALMSMSTACKNNILHAHTHLISCTTEEDLSKKSTCPPFTLFIEMFTA
jgi:hypothetical protein